MKTRLINTPRKGAVRIIVFREEKTWYGVALEFNIVVSGTNKESVFFDLHEAIKGYVEAVKKSGARAHALNQKADPEYERLWKKLESGKSIPSPYHIAHYGTQLIDA